MDVNIKLVAQKAGVSISTVSRVLNTPGAVRRETRERVMQVMGALNYKPNAVARSLSSKQTRSIGLIVPNVSDFFVNELHKGVNRAAATRGMKVILYDAESNSDRVISGIRFMQEHQVDGIVYASDYITAEHDQLFQRLKIPVALVLTESSNPELTAFKVDDVQASFDAVKYLVSRGHRNIGMISGYLTDIVTGRSRFEGYRMALSYHGLPFNDSCVAYGDYRYNHGYAAMSTLLAKRSETNMSAVFAASDEMAIGAMRCAYDVGLRVPDDISVIGFDDLPMADMVTPKLTTVKQPFERIGGDAVHYLVDILEGKRREQHGGVHYLPHQIIGRESVGLLLQTESMPQ